MNYKILFVILLLLISIFFISGCTKSNGKTDESSTSVGSVSEENYDEYEELGNRIRGEIENKLNKVE